jgi:hypothetical protein
MNRLRYPIPDRLRLRAGLDLKGPAIQHSNPYGPHSISGQTIHPALGEEAPKFQFDRIADRETIARSEAIEHQFLDVQFDLPRHFVFSS